VDSEPPLMIPVDDVLPHLMPAKHRALALALLEDHGVVIRVRNRQGPKVVRMALLRQRMPELYTRLLLARADKPSAGQE